MSVGLSVSFRRVVCPPLLMAGWVVVSQWALAAEPSEVKRTVDLTTIYQKAKTRDPVFEAATYALQASLEKLPQAQSALLPTLGFVTQNGRQFGDLSVGDLAKTPTASSTGQTGSGGKNTLPYQPDYTPPSGPYTTEPGSDTGGVLPSNVDELVAPGDPPVDGPNHRNVKTRSWALQLSMPILKPVAWAGVGQAQAQIRQAQAVFETARQDLILRVAQAYLDVLVAKDNRLALEQQLTAMDAQLILAKRNFQVGTSTVTDVHEAKSRFDLGRSQLVNGKNEEQAKRAELEKILGEPVGDLAQLSADMKLSLPNPADMEAWLTRAKVGNLAVKIQNEATDVSDAELLKSKAAHFPTLDLTANRGANYSSGSMTSLTESSTKTRSVALALQLSVPLYSGGATVSKVNEAAANLNKAKAELEAAQRQAVHLAKIAYYGVMNGIAQVEALESGVFASAQSLEANRIGYQIGTRINVDVLNAQQQWYAAQRDLSRAKVDTLMHGLKLKASVGGLSETDLNAINELLVRESEPQVLMPMVPAVPPLISATATATATSSTTTGSIADPGNSIALQDQSGSPLPTHQHTELSKSQAITKPVPQRETALPRARFEVLPSDKSVLSTIVRWAKVAKYKIVKINGEPLSDHELEKYPVVTPSAASRLLRADKLDQAVDMLIVSTPALVIEIRKDVMQSEYDILVSTPSNGIGQARRVHVTKTP